MARLALSLLGPLDIALDHQPVSGLTYDKVRALLAYLALEAGPHRREALAELFWPEQEGAAARTSLRVALTTLRRALGDQAADLPFLLVTRETVQINPASDYTLDVTAFTDLLHMCEQHGHPREALCAPCVERLAQAVALYRGEFLQQVVVRDSMAFEEWVTLNRERLHRHALDALALLAAYHEGQGADDLARQYAWRTLALERWDEAAHRCLMRVLARSGQRAAALAQYERCRKVLTKELGVEPAAETTELYEQIRTGALARSVGRSPAPTPADLDDDQRPSAPTNLPASLTPLIGREQDLARLRIQMRDKQTRLLTLVGPPGIGKTRLALQGAAELRVDSPDGVFFVELAPINDPQLVTTAIARVLGLADAGELPLLERLKRHLHSKQTLLLLDNFEHLAAAAPLLAELLAAAPKLKIVVTSRTALRISGEREYAVPPLALPNLQRLPPPADLARVAAVALFVQRAQAVDADFTLTPTNAPAVAEICSRLDGLPLALELAAARSKLFAPVALLKRLDRRLMLLTDGPRDLPSRQRTLRDTIAWSYELLNVSEQTLFRRLGVFVGGCTLEAAEAVCDSDGDLGIAVVDGLAALVDKSLLQHEEGPASELRLTMLETIREYALEQLGASGELESLRRRHAAFFVTLAEAIQPALRRPEHRSFLDRLELEHPNFRAALAWSQMEAEGTTGLRLAVALNDFWLRRGYFSEGRRWLIDALTPRAGRVSQPNTAASQALRAKALNHLGTLAAWQSDWAAAQAAYEESLAVFQELGDVAGTSDVLGLLGMVFEGHGDYERSSALFEESLTLSRQLGDTGRTAWCLFFQGTLVYALGDLTRARAIWEESLTLGQLVGDPWKIASCHLHLGIVAREQSDDQQANMLLVESLTVFRDLGDRWLLALALEVFAGLVADQGYRQADAHAYGHLAAQIFGAVEALRETIGGPRQPIYQDHYQRGVAAARALLDDTTFATAWAEGRAMPLDQAIAAALEWSQRATGLASSTPLRQPPPTNLPAPPTPLIGRERELADLGGLLRRPEVRLVTLTGAGGSGKTRLALELADSLQDGFPDGVFLVELAPVRQADLVASTIATTLGLKDAGAQPLVERLTAYLQKRRVLLLLDNFEHVLDAAPVLATLLGTCRSLKLLVTSRASLRLRGEREVEVAPLAVPDLRQSTNPDPEAQAAAVRLFVARVRDVRPDFVLTQENAASVNEICVRLDGLPLALELAAARIKLLSPQALLARLGSRLQLLTGGARDLPARQQTIRATIDWSYNLLSGSEQRLFTRLAVFVGGCTLEAAEAVCNADGDLPWDVIDGLAALLDRSLLRRVGESHTEPRVMMLETMREYALLQLTASGEHAQIERDHAAYFLEQAKNVQQDEIAWLNRLEADHDNLRAALRWSLRHDAATTGLELCTALWWFWESHGHWNEGRRWFEEMLAAASNAAPRLRMEALGCVGEFAWKQGDYATATARMTESLALSRALDDQSSATHRLMLLGTIALHQGDYDYAATLLNESLEMGRTVGEVAGPLLHLGEMALAQGQYAQAQQWLEESLTICREASNTFFVARLHCLLGEVALGQGDPTGARVLLRESVALGRAVRHRRVLAFALTALGSALAAGSERRAEDVQHAACIWGAAEVLREEIGIFLPIADRTRYNRSVALARVCLSLEAWEAAWAEGRAMSLEKAVAYGLEVSDSSRLASDNNQPNSSDQAGQESA